MAQTHKVNIQNMAFDPASITIAAGDSVEWTNRMNISHTVTANSGEFDSDAIGTNQTFLQAFEASGTVAYHCKIHPFMTGTVTVA